MWIVLHLLLLLQRGACTGAHTFSTLTVRPGQNVTLTCHVNKNRTVEKFFWIRLVSGTFPEVLASMTHPGSPESGTLNTGRRITAKKELGSFHLHISQVEKSDTAVYYCFKVHLDDLIFLNGTFLQVTEPEPSVSVVSEVQPGQPVKFQCSVLSQSGNEICQDGHKLHWFRTGPDSVHPSFVYTHDECNDSFTQKCIHTFSKNVSSSDAGTYFCAVATCGRIFKGTQINVTIEDVSRCDSNTNVIFVVSAALALSFIMSAFLINKIRTKHFFCCKAGPQTVDKRSSCIQQTDEDSLVYSMPTIVTKKTGKARQTNVRAAEEFSTYGHISTQN
ncbi:uncharacterized protein LOC129190035 isoform X2 [Dunckerocampus dactyliophorus]|uniref:uncharacterized protein LOC129190035 isoform X2 n=1 Tax=Dunckerocampus dactyliophorus TaxID=161453 RepID=UPI002405C3AD|nr:uncharacterized protein LOC129190035 isoform X2 [Dunckerocampus dactyliophorus]